LPEEGTAQAGLDNGLRPDANRRKEPLEAFPLDSLRMVGTVERGGQRWAIIKDTDGTVHRIATGSYIGQNDGKIESISEEKMIINELVLDAAGTWHERKAFIALTDESNPKSTTK
jgi:type IV pilus assembly protein PilP